MYFHIPANPLWTPTRRQKIQSNLAVLGFHQRHPCNPDGRKRNHLKQKKFQKTDQELCDSLICFEDEGQRTIKTFERKKILPKGTDFYSEPLSLACAPDKSAKLQAREKWVERGFNALREAELVFFDPDNGFEVASSKKHWKRGPKYVFYDELTRYVENHQTVIGIQFAGRSKGGVDQVVLEKKRCIKQQSNFNGDIKVIKSSAGSAILYFILIARDHTDRIAEPLRRFVNGPAHSIFQFVD